jgi:hypothetical protein
MASVDELRLIIETVENVTGPHVGLASVEVHWHDGARAITLRTPTPGQFIGRRGATSDAIRAALSDSLDDPGLRLNIVSTEPDDPSSGPGGVREPRRPNPGAPSESSPLA